MPSTVTFLKLSRLYIYKPFKTIIMKPFLTTPTESESRKYMIFSNFRNTKRIRWSEYRHFGH